jgi:hypothetical protein
MRILFKKAVHGISIRFLSHVRRRQNLIFIKTFEIEFVQAGTRCIIQTPKFVNKIGIPGRVSDNKIPLMCPAWAFTVPPGMYLPEKAGELLSFIIAAMIFLVLFIFLPKIIRLGMMADTHRILELSGKNKQFRNVFWTVFITPAGFVLAQVIEPETAHQIVAVIMGAGI